MSDTDLTFPAAPVMTQRHVDAAWQCYRLFCFPGFADQQTLLEIWQHLTALLAQPVPSRELTPLERITHASNYVPPLEVATPQELIRAANKTLLGIATPEESALVESWNPDPVDVTPIVNPRRIAADGTLRYNGEHQPGQNTSSPADWRREYDPPTAEDCYLDCDQ